LERTGLELSEEDRYAVRDYIVERYNEEVLDFLEREGRLPTPEEKQEIIESIYDELIDLWIEMEFLGAEGGSLGDLEQYSDLEKFLFDLQGYWYYTVYYQQPKGDHKQ